MTKEVNKTSNCIRSVVSVLSSYLHVSNIFNWDLGIIKVRDSNYTHSPMPIQCYLCSQINEQRGFFKPEMRFREKCSCDWRSAGSNHPHKQLSQRTVSVYRLCNVVYSETPAAIWLDNGIHFYPVTPWPQSTYLTFLRSTTDAFFLLKLTCHVTTKHFSSVEA